MTLILAFIQKCEKSINFLCIFTKTVIESAQVSRIETMVFEAKTICVKIEM